MRHGIDSDVSRVSFWSGRPRIPSIGQLSSLSQICTLWARVWYVLRMRKKPLSNFSRGLASVVFIVFVGVKNSARR
jgi:hypothetical protein